MRIAISEFGQNGKKVTLEGKLDIQGAQEIELPMASVAGSNCDVIVDMAGVNFIASIGIRQLVIAAKTLSRRSRKLVLLEPSALVTEALHSAGLDDMLPVVRSEDEADAYFKAKA